MLYLGIDQHAKQLTVSLRNDAGDIVLKRQVSTEPKRCAEFFAKLQNKAGDEGYIAIVEVCGFNDWLLKLLPTVGCTQTILIQPTKKLKVKTDKRDAHSLSELLWVNQHRLRVGEPVRGVRQVTLPSLVPLKVVCNNEGTGERVASRPLNATPVLPCISWFWLFVD